MKTILSAAPYANMQGIKDVSGRAPVREPEALPSHLAHVCIFAQKGSTLPQLVSGDALLTTYGPKTMDTRSKYYNHGSVLVNTLQGEGNAVMIQRLKPADAGPNSRLLLSLDIVADQVQQYERNIDGSFKRNADGTLKPVTGAGATLPGFKARWVLNDWTAGSDTEAFGEVTAKDGGLVGNGGAQSTTYPIFELEASSFGEHGNNLGLRLMAPTTRSALMLNDDLAQAVKAQLLRLQLVERPDAVTSPTVVETLSGEQGLEFTFKPGAVDPKTDTEISFEDIFDNAYSDRSPGFPPVQGPFGRTKVYRENLELVLAMIGELEAPHGTIAEGVTELDLDSEWLYAVNPFTAQSNDGTPYYTLNVRGPLDGGLLFGDTATHYAAGGSDGTMNLATYDELVRQVFATYGDGEANLLDDAVYPQSVVYDTGFTYDTKLALLTPLGKRKDIIVILSTQDVTAPQNTTAQESSLATALMTAARNYPESEVFGTPVCRAAVIGHSGYLINSKYKGLLPLTIEIAQKFARYMGAGNGKWRGAAAPDMPPNNRIEMFRDVNVTFKAASVRNKDWANGLVWAENFDRVSLFIPALQSVYNDDSSVLNSILTCFVAVELEKIAKRTWRQLTGISKLTTGQFIQRSNKLIEQQANDRFDDRVVIKADTYYTDADAQRGYSWSTKIGMFADNMQSVGTYTIESARRADLEVGA